MLASELLSPKEYRQIITSSSAGQVPRDLTELIGGKVKGRGYHFQSADSTVEAWGSNEVGEAIIVFGPASPRAPHLLAAIRAYRDWIRAKDGPASSSFIELRRTAFREITPTTTIIGATPVERLTGAGIAKLGTMGLDLAFYAADQASVLRLVAERADRERAAAIIDVPESTLDTALAVFEVAQLQPTPLSAARVVLDSLTTLTQR